MGSQELRKNAGWAKSGRKVFGGVSAYTLGLRQKMQATADEVETVLEWAVARLVIKKWRGKLAIKDGESFVKLNLLNPGRPDGVKLPGTETFPVNQQKNMSTVIISGQHLVLTPAIKNLATEKFEKLFRHDHKILRAKVELVEEKDAKSPTGLRFTAKAILEGINAVASARSEDVYKSIDLLVRKLDAQLRRKHGAAVAKRKDALAA